MVLHSLSESSLEVPVSSRPMAIPAALTPLSSDPGTDRSRIFVLEVGVTSPFTVLQAKAKTVVEHWGRVDVVNNAAEWSRAERRIGVSVAGADCRRALEALCADC